MDRLDGWLDRFHRMDTLYRTDGLTTLEPVPYSSDLTRCDISFPKL